jgi:hypothetical protein
MRSYYGGRYIDRNQLTAQLELRIEFKHNVNARIDYGFGKNTEGFVFNFAEAF